MKRILIIITAVLLLNAFPAAGTDVPIMSKENLKEQLGSSKIMILDARSESHWEDSIFKIPGAVRTPVDQIDVWAGSLPKDKIMVVYCACNGLGTSGGLVRQLLARGFKQAYALDGGWRDWYGSAFPIQEKR